MKQILLSLLLAAPCFGQIMTPGSGSGSGSTVSLGGTGFTNYNGTYYLRTDNGRFELNGLSFYDDFERPNTAPGNPATGSNAPSGQAYTILGPTFASGSTTSLHISNGLARIKESLGTSGRVYIMAKPKQVPVSVGGRIKLLSADGSGSLMGFTIGIGTTTNTDTGTDFMQEMLHMYSTYGGALIQITTNFDNYPMGSNTLGQLVPNGNLAVGESTDIGLEYLGDNRIVCWGFGTNCLFTHPAIDVIFSRATNVYWSLGSSSATNVYTAGWDSIWIGSGRKTFPHFSPVFGITNEININSVSYPYQNSNKLRFDILPSYITNKTDIGTPDSADVMPIVDMSEGLQKWVDIASLPSGSPAGGSLMLQYNNGGALGAVSNALYDPATGNFILTNAIGAGSLTVKKGGSSSYMILTNEGIGNPAGWYLRAGGSNQWLVTFAAFRPALSNFFDIGSATLPVRSNYVDHLYIGKTLSMIGSGQATQQWYRIYSGAADYDGLEVAANQATNLIQAITAGTGEDNIDIELKPAGTGTINLNGPIDDNGYVQSPVNPVPWGVSTNYVIVDLNQSYQTFICTSNAYHFIHSTNKPSGSTIVKPVRIKIYAGPTNRFVSFNASWHAITTNRFIHSNGVAFLTLDCDGPYETNVSALLLSQPTP